MKTKNLTLISVAIMALTSFTALAQENKDAAKARKNIAKSKLDLKEAKTDSAEDFKTFKKIMEEKIEENDKKILALKAKKASDNKEAASKYNEKVQSLAKKNDQMRSNIANSNTTKTSMWTKFKADMEQNLKQLNSDIDQLQKDLSK